VPPVERGARAHYEDPTYYGWTYRQRTADAAYYVAAAKVRGGPVLEYGVGNGRIALEVARAGIEVVGVDCSAPMLADFRTRLKGAPAEVRRRVELRLGDMRSLRLRRRFPLIICPFNALLHLYSREDVDAFLTRVSTHLLPGGHFVFDVLMPRPQDLHVDPKRSHSLPSFVHPTTGVATQYSERFEYDPLRQVMTMWMEFRPRGGESTKYPLTHRYFFPRELEALLHHAGFVNATWRADFSPRAPGPDTDVLVVTCQKPLEPAKRRKSSKSR
jgi:SAM-dependent methyltransferase